MSDQNPEQLLGSIVEPIGLLQCSPLPVTSVTAVIGPAGGVLLPKRIAFTTDLFVILEYLVSVDNLAARRVTGQLNHFSNYAVAW